MNGVPSLDKTVFKHASAVVVGNVVVGRNSGIWPGAVIRGDEEQIVIGNETSIQDNAVLHCDYDYPMTIGNHVTIGHGAIVHGCTVGDDSLIGMGAIVLNGARIGKACIIGAGAVVTEGSEIPDGSVVVGVPGKIIKTDPEGNKARNRKNADAYVALAEEYKKGKFRE